LTRWAITAGAPGDVRGSHKTSLLVATTLAGLSTATATHAGTRLGAEVLVSPNVSIGFAPRVLFGIKPDDLEEHDNDGTVTELDLAVRFAGHIPLGRSGAELQLHASPGSSVPERDPGVADGLAGRRPRLHRRLPGRQRRGLRRRGRRHRLHVSTRHLGFGVQAKI
jgi:hypothetical protein